MKLIKIWFQIQKVVNISKTRASHRIFSALLLPAIFSACASTSQSLVVHPTEGDPQNLTGLWLDTLLEIPDDHVDRDGCNLILKRADLKDAVAILPIKNGTQQGIYQIPPGAYQLSELDCDRELKWQFGKVSDLTFYVVRGQVSTIGVFKARLKNKQSTLLTSVAIQEQITPSFKKRAERKNLISGFTRLAITPAFLEAPRAKKITITHATLIQKKGDPVSAAVSLNKPANFFDSQPCDQMELDKNPVVYGQLKFEVEYSKGHFQKISKWINDSTHSPEYENCIKGVVESFSPLATEAFTHQAAL